MKLPLDPILPGDEEPNHFGDRVRSGALWAGASTLILRFANIAIMAVVARIVSPDELGAFALTLVAYGVVVSVAELGVASAIARSDLDLDRIAPTVATISIGTSLVLAGLLAFYADPLAMALGSADAAGSLRVMALCVAMIGPFAVPGAQLQRELRQDLVFRANAIAFLPGAAVLIGVAMLGDGALAFAWSRVAGQALVGTLMLFSVSKRYRPGFQAGLVRPLLRFGVPLALANLLSQVLLNVDYVFVGRMLTIADVGLYNLAFNVCMWSTAVIGSTLNGIVLPAFSKVKRDGGDLSHALAAATRTVAVVAFPIGALTLALAEPLIVTVYGAQWVGAVAVLRILCLYGVLSVICLLLANVIVSSGRTGVLFVVQAVALAVLVPIMWAGVTLGGLLGVGAAHIVVIVVATFPLYAIAIRRSIGAGPLVILRAMLWPASAAVLSGTVAWAVASALPAPGVSLLVGGLCGSVVFLVLTARLLQDLLPSALANRRAVRAVFRLATRPAGWLSGRAAGRERR